jgi:ABC-type lipoprotein export system ATPase subunit
MKAGVIKLDQVMFRYPHSSFSLRIDHLEIASGQAVAFIGPSGSGKTTLLHLIGGVALPESGSVQVRDIEVNRLSEPERRAFRLTQIGLVFQEFELLAYLNVLDNILLPCRISPVCKPEARLQARAQALAEEVGLRDNLRRFPGQLSQGEKQRVAVCRALLLEPPLLLADEPTGNLDPVNKGRIMEILFRYARERDATLVTVTHDQNRLEPFDHVVDFHQFHPGNGPDASGTPGGKGDA